MNEDGKERTGQGEHTDTQKKKTKFGRCHCGYLGTLFRQGFLWRCGACLNVKTLRTNWLKLS